MTPTDSDNTDNPDIEPLAPSNRSTRRLVTFAVVAVLFSVVLLIVVVRAQRQGAADQLTSIKPQGVTAAEKETIAGDPHLTPVFPDAKDKPPLVKGTPPNKTDPLNLGALGLQTPLDILNAPPPKPAAAASGDGHTDEYRRRMAVPKVKYLQTGGAKAGPLGAAAVAATTGGLDINAIESALKEAGLDAGKPAPTPEDKRAGWFKAADISNKAVKAKFLTDMEFTLLESTAIPIVIDQAINSQLPGRLRATVSDDVWSADGSRILVPRLTRVMGEYQSGVSQGQSRVFIIWSRLLDPYGMDVPIASGSSDAMGMAGIEGTVDTHFWQRFGGSFLVSIVGGAAQSESKNDNQRQYASQAFSDASSVALKSSINIPPTITTKPGMEAFIYVNQDINFKEAYAYGLAAKEARQHKIQSNIDQRKALLITELNEEGARAARRISTPIELPKFAHPNPFSLGRLPERPTGATATPAAKTPDMALAGTSASPAAPATPAAQRCGPGLTIAVGDLLSQVVSRFMATCGVVLPSWLVQGDNVVDYQFTEGASVTMPSGMASLAYLLRTAYAISLVPTGDNGYSVSLTGSPIPPTAKADLQE